MTHVTIHVLAIRLVSGGQHCIAAHLFRLGDSNDRGVLDDIISEAIDKFLANAANFSINNCRSVEAD